MSLVGLASWLVLSPNRMVGFVGRITGVDSDPNMLAVARKKVPLSGVQIEWREGNALDLPFDSESFDLVLCQQGIQYFSDAATGFKNMYRVLAPGGRVAILVAASINPEHQPRKWAEMEALRKHVSDEAAEKERHPGYFQGDPTRLKTLVSDGGFNSVELKVLLEYWGPKGSLEKLIPEEDYPDLEPGVSKAVVTEIREALRSYAKGPETQLPIGFYIAIGYK